jgi:large repetitive protein
MGAHLGWRRFVAGLVALLASPILAALVSTTGVLAADPPNPSVGISTSSTGLIGQNVGIDLNFTNTSAVNVGYGPYIDIRMPMGADGNDGLTFAGATYLGASVTAIPLVADITGCITHPYAVAISGAPVQVCGLDVGQSYVVLRLPFGSFTPGQPAATIHVTATMSTLADAGTPLSIIANGGFQFGADPLANPTTDPSILGSTTSAGVTPSVLTVSKHYLGPESETATGPNFPEGYTINVTVAPGQTVTNLVVTDTLPNNMQYVSTDVTTPASAPVFTPSTSTPGGTLSRNFGTIVGTGGTDATMTFRFYIPRLDSVGAAVLNASTGAFAPSVDSASAGATWTPIDVRDTAGPVAAGPSTHTLTDKSVAIQKSVSLSSDIGPAGASPGDTVQWTMVVEVSDFFALNNLNVDDLLGDGTRVDDTFTPTLAVSGNGFNSATAVFDAANYTIGAPDGVTGKTSMSFHVSDELGTRGRPNGRLVGGCINPATGSAPPDCSAYNDGPTTLTIVLRSIIQRTYVDGTTEVVEGDTLANLTAVTADVLNTGTWAPTGSNIGDGSAAVATAGSGASVTIARGSLQKSIYAINGSTSFPTPIHVSPGDTVTYRLEQTFPTSRTDDFRVLDYLPLPVFHAAGVTTFDPTVSVDAPPAGQAKYGPDDTFSALAGAPDPTIATDVTANSVEFEYGNYALYPPAPSTSDLLFSVTVSTDPFADGLLLTNQARSQTRNSVGTLSTADAIVQITLDQPVLTITKGVVGTDNGAAALSPTTAGPVTFDTVAASPSISCPGWTGGPITSAGLAADPIDSNISGVDAGDYVRFAVVVQNTGHSSAFEVQIADTLPAGFVVPSGGLDMCVVDGAGSTVLTSDIGGGTGLFDQGIQLHDGPGGSLAAGTSGGVANTTGTNIAVITYTLKVDTSAVPDSLITNTASLLDFTNDTDASSHLASPITDMAFVTLTPPAAAKAIAADSEPSTTLPAVAVGEIVDYRVTLTIPEGTLPAAQLTDTLPAGLGFLGCTTVTPSSPDLSTSLAGGFGDACHATGEPPLNPTVSGQNVVFDLGTLTNANTNNGTAETLVLTYRVVVLNVGGAGGNTRGKLLHNSAALSWSGGSIAPVSASDVRVVEPRLTVTKGASSATGDAGDTITYTINVQAPANPDGADAFNVSFADSIPAGMTYVTDSFEQTSGVPVTAISDAGGLTASWDVFPAEGAAAFTYDVTIDASVTPAQVLHNTADVTWTSLPGDVTSPQSTFSGVSTERTGDTGNPGGAANNYTASDDADVTVPNATVSKSVFDTDQGFTTNPAVAIGEVITYRAVVTIPEGTQPSARLTDTLGVGLGAVACVSVTASSTDVVTDLPGGFDDACDLGSNPTVAGQVVTFDLGSITNNNRDNGTAETITLTYTVVVQDVGANSRGVLLHNSAVYSWTGGNSAAGLAADVKVVEPIMTILKTRDPGTGDAGDTITFTITISNPTDVGGNGTDAFDAHWTDLIPNTPGLTYVPGSLKWDSGNVPDALVDGTAPDLSATWDTFGQGTTSVLEYRAKFDDNVPSGSSYTNTAYLTWTSLPGGDANERTGTGIAPDTYKVQSQATVSVTQPAPVKSVVTTSEAGTTDTSRLEIGEIVRYRVVVTIPEGITQNVSIRDTLPAGLRYLNDSTTKVAFVTNDAGMTSSTLSDPELAVTGDDSWAGHPTYVLPGGDISGGLGAPNDLNGFRSGDDPIFSLGNLTNSDRDADVETVVIEFNVLLDNVVGNQSGTGLADQAAIWGGGTPAQIGLSSNTVTETVAEPNIVNGTTFTKTTPTSPVDAGDAIVYRITITNTAGANTSPAYEYRVTDTIPGSVVVPGAPAVVCTNGYTDNSVGSSIDVTLTQIDPGQTCTITITSTVGTTEVAGRQFTNTANGAYSSLPGTTGTATGSPGNDTGSTNPGATGQATGERNSSGGVGTLNDYVNTGAITKTLAVPSIAKNIPTLVNTPIGATTTFDLVVTLPEGVTNGLIVTDTLPAGLTPVSYQIVTTAAASGGRLAADFAGTLPAETESAKPAGSAGGLWSLTFGATTVPCDGSGTNDKFLVKITAQVANIVGNQGATVRSNTARVTYTNPQSGVQNVNAPTARTVTVYEPTLQVAKSISASNPRFGDVVTYTLTLSHVGGATDIIAYDITLVDTLPTGLTYVPSSLTRTAGQAGTTAGESGGVITITYDSLALATTSQYQYQATITTTTLKQSLVNSAVANWTSLSGADANERTGTDGVGGALNDYRAIITAPTTTSGVDMAITKSDGAAVPTAAAVLPYVVTYINNGNQTATDVVITETVPVGTTFNLASSTGTWTGCANGAAAGTVCHLAVGSVTAAGTASFTFAVTVVDPIPSGMTQISNTATIADDGSKNVDPTPLDNTATDVDPIPQADLWLTKTVDILRPGANQNVVYTITLHNDGPANATGVRVTDLVPAGLTYVSSVPGAGNSYVSGSGLWTIAGTVNAGTSKTLTITARASTTTVSTNVAEVTHSNQADPDSTPGNGIITEDDYATATTTPTVADLGVTKVAGNTHPNLGSDVTFTIVATNYGPDDATGAKVVDTLPAGLTFVSATPSVGSWAGSTWTIGTLNNGASASMTLVAHVANPGTITNTATVSADPFDLVPGNNTASDSVSQTLDLAVAKSVDNPIPNVGTLAAFTVTITNTGINAAHNVVIHDALPAGLTYSSYSASQGTYSSVTGNWTIGTIATSGSVSMTLNATVAGHVAMTNTASVLSLSEAQTSTANDSASATVTPPQADLAVTKIVDIAGPEIGAAIQFTVSVVNHGPDGATNVAVADLLPAGLTFSDSDATQGGYNYITGTWTIGSLAKDATATLTVDATVAAGGIYTNTAVVAAEQYDPNLANNTSSAGLTSRMADIGVTKTVDKPTPNVGDAVTYTLTVTNNGPDPATQLVVGDLLPAGLSLTSATPSRGSYVSSSGAWTIGNLAVGTSVTMTVVERVTASGRIDNTLAVTSLLQTDTVPANDSDTATINVPPAADLAVTKNVDVSHPDVGDNVTYTIVAGNNGPDDATSVTVTDALPAGLSFVSATPSAGSYASNTWTIGDLDNGDTATLTLVATVDDLGSIANTAVIDGTEYDPVLANNTDTATIDQLVDIAVTKTVDDATPNVGTIATFTVTVTNSGPSTATGVVINDSAPTGLTFIAFNPSQGSYSDASGDWTIGAIAPSGSVTATVQALVTGSTTMTNTAAVADVDEPQSSTANDSDSATVTPPHADLAIVKTVDVARPDVGDADSFTITLTNNGSATATHVAVTDQLPAGLTYTDSTASQGSYDDTSGVWTVGTLASGASATLTIDVTVDASNDYSNVATVTASDQYDPDPDNNTDSADLSTRVADIAVTKTPSNPTPAVGAAVTFTITVTNNGPDPATQIVIHDALPAGLTYISSSPDQGAYDPATKDWTLGGLADGDNTQMTITARVIDSGTITNTAAVSHLLQRDPVAANDSDTASVDAPPAADLSLTKGVDNDMPDKGTNVTFTLSIVNHGPDGATGIVVNDALPAGLTYVSDDGAGAYDSVSGDWAVGSLAKGDGATLHVTATVDVEGPIVNVAEVTASSLPDPDSTPGNGAVGEDDRATASLNARGLADLSLAKSVAGGPAVIGNQVTYTLVVTNHGPDAATGVVVRDSLPPGVTYVSSAGGAYNHITGAWTVGGLANGASATLTITVRIGVVGSIVNTAEVVGETQRDPNSTPDNNVAGENDQGSASILGARATPPPTVVASNPFQPPTGSLAFVLGAVALMAAGIFLVVASRRLSPVRVRTRPRPRRRRP